MIRRLLEHSDITAHVCLQPLGHGEPQLKRQRHLMLGYLASIPMGVHRYYPNTLRANAATTMDVRKVTFCPWNPCPSSRLRPDPDRQVRFTLNPEISILQEANREGPSIVAAYHNSSSYACAGECIGLAQIQSGRGYCCSCEYWPPEHSRPDTLYRAFLDNIPYPSRLKQHFPERLGNMTVSLRGYQIPAAGWQLSCHVIWLHASGDPPTLAVYIYIYYILSF